MRITMTTPEGVLNGVLNDSKASQTLIDLLPLQISFKDLFEREKYGKLPTEVSLTGRRIFGYEKALIAYWSPGNDIVFFYDEDGQSIPAPGLIALGRITKGLSLLKTLEGPFTATIALVK